MQLKNLLSAIDILDVKNGQDLEINHVAYHSKKVRADDLFVCIKGYQVDGHDYLKSAIENGCTAAIVEDFMDVSIPQYRVKNSRAALASLADYFYGHPSQAMKTIGITATNGKTTTSFMLNEILEAAGLKTGLIGTVIVKMDDEQEAAVLTTPESLDLQNYFHKMLKKGVSHVTMEVSSSALETQRTLATDFDIAALNNISREHIDSHGSFENYYNFKASLIRNLKKEGQAILNMDDPYSKQLVHETKAQVLTYGVKDETGDLSVSNLDLSTGIAKYTLHIKKPIPGYSVQSFDVTLSIPGYHCVYNSLAAIAMAMALGIDVESIQAGIQNFKGIERRFEMVFDHGFKIMDDHFANAGNINVTLETLDYMEYKNLTLVYAIRGSRGVTVNRENAETMVKWAAKLGLKEVIATSSISHVTWKDEVTPEELAVFNEVMKAAGIRVIHYDQLEDAITHGLKQVSQDDVLLLAGCQGMDYGCNIAVNILEKMRPDITKEELRRPLKHRVCGILEGDFHEQ